MVRTPDFHSGNRGSIPLRVAKRPLILTEFSGLLVLEELIDYRRLLISLEEDLECGFDNEIDDSIFKSIGCDFRQTDLLE